MANELTRFRNPETGGFGLQHLQQARAAGLSDDQIRRLLPDSGGTGGIGRAAAQALGLGDGSRDLNANEVRQAAAPAPPPAPARPTPSGSNQLTSFLNPETLGFGQGALDRARASGLSDAQIRELLPGSGVLGVGKLAAGSLGLADGNRDLSGSEIYQATFQASLRDYQQQSQKQLEEAKGRTQQLETSLSSLQGELGAAQAAREEARLRADAFEQQRNQERQLSADSQLRSLRAGSTVSGTPGAGLGSLTTGQAVTATRSAGAGREMLDSYLRRLDPTDSVLDRKGPVVEAMGSGSSGGGSALRAEASRRALAGGGAGYYARRFG